MISPDALRFYPVAGSYDSNGDPHGGFVASLSMANVTAVGRDCIGKYVTPTDSRQVWRQTSWLGGDLGTVWYQGSYAPTANSLQDSYLSVEAFMQMSAYRFTVPDTWRNAITHVSAVFTNGGAALCTGAADDGSQLPADTSFVDWESEEDGFWASFALSSSLVPYASLSSLPTVYGDLDDPGPYGGSRNLWGFTGSPARDGMIPTLIDPDDVETTSYDGNPFSSSGTIWVIPYFSAAAGTNYIPRYVPTTEGKWVCASLWNVRLKVTIG